MSVWSVGPWSIDSVRQHASRGAEQVSLTTNEVLLLRHLHEQGEPVQRAEILHHVFGYAKTVKSRAVDMALTRLRAKLETDPKRPVWIRSRRGVGVWLEDHAEGARVASEEVPNLRFGTPYMPREDDEQAVLELLEVGWRVVTVVGPGGVGKTRLTVEASRRVPGEVVVVPLGGCTDLASVVHRVGAALGAEGLEGIHRALTARRALCVLDEAELALSAVRQLVVDAANARFLVTSRQPLDVEGESVVELQGLSGDLARRFLRSRLAASRRNRGLGDEEVDEALPHLDGLPLAMELAAAHPAGLPALVASLSEGTSPRGGAWLQATVQRSLSPLDEDQRQVLATLCLFEGPLDAVEVEGLFGAEGAQVFYDLVDRSLLARQDGGWLVLRTLRAEVSGLDLDWPALRERRDEWLTQRCEAIGLAWRSDLGASRRFRRLLPTLVAALPELSPQRTTRVATAVVHIVDATGPVGLRHAIIRAAVAKMPDDPRSLALSAMLPEAGDKGPLLAPALSHGDPEVRFLGLDLKVSMRAGDVPESEFAAIAAAAVGPYQSLQIELWRLDAETFHHGTGFEALTLHVSKCSRYAALHTQALRTLADVRYGQEDHARCVALYDEVLQAFERHDLRRAVLVTGYLRALSLGAIDPRAGLAAHLANMEARSRHGESTVGPRIAAGLLAFGLRDLSQAEELLSAALQAGVPERRRVIAEMVLAATRATSGDDAGRAKLLAVDDATYGRRHRDGSPAGPAFRVWAHGEVALLRSEDPSAVQRACDEALEAPVRPVLGDLLRGLRMRAAQA